MPHRVLSNYTLLLKFLNQLFDTNEEFAHLHDEAFFDNFRDEQSPYMTILKCSDSRVQMESFDKTPQNGVFAIRNIGNQISTCAGSIEFGVRVLKTPILLITGHSGCGAIEAVLKNTAIESESIKKELSTLCIKEKHIAKAIVENVNNQVDVATSRYSDLISEGKLVVIGAVYDFKNDLGFGKGKIVFININNIKDFSVIKNIFGDKVRNLNFFSPLD